MEDFTKEQKKYLEEWKERTIEETMQAMQEEILLACKVYPEAKTQLNLMLWRIERLRKKHSGGEN